MCRCSATPRFSVTATMVGISATPKAGGAALMREVLICLWHSVVCALLFASSIALAADESHRVFRVGFVASQAPSTAPDLSSR